MAIKELCTDFGKFTFLDKKTVVATANHGTNIDATKVQLAIDLIENELSGPYALILDRKSDYSIVPVEVYSFFSSIKRIKAIAIVRYNEREILPNNMEEKIFGKNIEKFSTINEAHEWTNSLLKK